MDTAKIKVKIGVLEVEYEGPSSFLKDDLKDLLATIGTISVPLSNDRLPESTDQEAKIESRPLALEHKQASPPQLLSTNTIVAHMTGSGSADLVLAALGHLQICKGMTSASRAEILEEIKGATSYFRESMGGNLPRTLSNLVKSKKLNQVASDAFALSAAEKKTVESVIATI